MVNTVAEILTEPPASAAEGGPATAPPEALPVKRVPRALPAEPTPSRPAPTMRERPPSTRPAGPLLKASCAEIIRENFRRLKGAFDFVIAFALLVAAAPLILATGLLIKLTSRGPILFSQIRVGQDGRLFRMYKLRSMIADSERKTGPVWARKNDPRVTPIGRFLRATHLDELPQLVNVLKGDMSLVGPRPERPTFVEKFCKQLPSYRRRLAVKPGITGLAQVHHRYDETLEDVRKKLAYDLLYIRSMCWAVDLEILFQTLGKLTGKGAH